ATSPSPAAAFAPFRPGHPRSAHIERSRDISRIGARSTGASTSLDTSEIRAFDADENYDTES
ncbi:MAG: hypothetical protein J0H88_00970, partial [Sphingomonadales bacterium]|nr:hypothetical protein [Sphingomonadales bacterium]